MEEGTSDKGKILSSFELEKELSDLVTKAVIPSFVADKIKDKLNKAGLKLTLVQLYDLIDIIKREMKIKQHSKYPPQLKETKESSDFGGLKKDEDAAVTRIFNTIERLSARIKSIEEARLKNLGKPHGRIVTTDDIVIPEKINVPRQGKVYPLQEIPNDPENVVVLMKWLQYLVDKVGKDKLLNVLEYYVDIGWLSDAVITNLIEYSEGITEEIREGEEQRKNPSNLQTKDHLQSLLFIQRLKGEQPDSYFLNRIERELSKMTKTLGNI